jgi:hypothetical protein
MAVVRWGSLPTHGYESDLYIIETETGYQCVGCPLNPVIDGQPPAAHQEANTLNMGMHVIDHQQAGHTVPEWVLARLADREAGHRYPDPVLADMVAAARNSPDGEGIVITDDIDVPADVRVSLAEFLKSRGLEP